MATPVKSEADLEQIALAMMMMAGGEGTSTKTKGVKTRSSLSRVSLEPVSGGNCLNNNRNHDQPGSSENDDDFNPPDRSPNSPSDLVIKEEEPDEAIICAINPMSIQSSPSPGSPAGSQKSTNSGSGSGQASNYSPYISSARRIFKPEFKQLVLDAFSSDPECVGNQRATARKFGIHRRQVQKWLQQYSAGELTFKDSPQSSPQNNQDFLTEQTALPTKKGVSSASQQLPSKRSKVLRRSAGNLSSAAHQKSSDPSSRPTRFSARNRGKSMPLKGGSKSTSHFVPTIVHPSSSSTSSSLINLSKSSKQNGGGNNSGNSSSYAYFNDTNGNGNSANGGSSGNMFMNMSSFFASAAAANNFALPLSLENPRNVSPREHSPIQNNGRGSPTHSAGGSSGGSGSNNTNLQNALLLVDELNHLYPYSDFSLLRKALLKEEVSLEKLAHPLLRGRAEFRVNGNGINNDMSQGLRDLRRATALSPSPAKSSSSSQEYNTQQTLDIIRQQQEYLKLLQQCGIGNSTDLSSGGLNATDLSNNGRLPAWFNPFAAAAAAGLPIQSTSSGAGKLSSGVINGSNGGSENRRKVLSTDTSDNHRFASPRVPPAVNSGKAKTVAAALAATRVQPLVTIPQGIGRHAQNNQSHGKSSQNQRSAQRRKGNSRQVRTMSQNMDDDIDPTSMLEVVTSIPSPSSSPRINAALYGYNNNHRSISDYNNQNQGMDLTTAVPSQSATTATSTTTRLISKAMNKEYSFLNELGLVRKSQEEAGTTSTNGYGITHTASLENFVQNILPSRQKSPQATSSSTSSSSPPATETGCSDTDKTKNMVIDAFNCDPEISGDARAVARKFGLNARLVMKWLKEGPVKATSLLNEGYHVNENGLTAETSIHVRINGGVEEDEDSSDYLQTQNMHKTLMSESNNNSPGSGNTVSVNKRKNSKPNQICDFPEDDNGMNVALDMVVPIKKRRVSSPSPTP